MLTEEQKDQQTGSGDAFTESEERMGQEQTTDAKMDAGLELDALNAELAGQKDKYIRLAAEFDNYKKRTVKERIELIRNASQELIQDMLVILDDFERAKKLSEEENNEQIFPEGMKLVYQKFTGILHAKGLEAMSSDGVAFDPEIHEAITEFPAPSEEMKGKVIETIEKGYTLNHKIIRFAKVVVAK
jgi:molecular chaperone GrpE